MKKYLFPLFFAVFTVLVSLCAGAQIITTVAGNGVFGYGGDGGPATNAKVEYVWFVTTDNAGDVYITDNFDHRIREVNTADTISTFAGNGVAGFFGDGGPAGGAEFIGAAGIAMDRMGNTFFSDINNRRLRMINSLGIMSTICGDGVAAFSGDDGPSTSAQLNAPYGVAVDYSGNVYVADELNYRVRKINRSTGIITTVAGDGVPGYSGDHGQATIASMTPTGIAVDAIGNLYIATNNRIRKVDTAGIITTIAGTGVAAYGGDDLAATAAKLNQPIGVSVDALGNVFVSDQYNYRIRKINTAGIITTIAGTGTPGSSGDGGPALAAELRQPLGVSTDPYNNVYFCDWGNNKVRKIASGNHLPHFVNGLVDSMAVCENSANDSFSSLLATTDADTGQTEKWMIIAGAQHGSATLSWSATSTGDTLLPSGAMYTPHVGYFGFDTFMVRVDDGQSIDTLIISVRVKPLPDTGTIAGNANICMGTPDTLNDTTTGGTWSVSNTAFATVSSAGVVTGVTPGIDTVRLSFVQEACTNTASAVVTVFPVTDTITGAAAVCTGQNITMIGGPAGGTWNITNTFAHVSGDRVFGDSAGVDTVIYTIVNVCGIFTTTQPVTVIGFTIPGVTVLASPALIRPGVYDTLTAHIVHGGGISYNYQWVRDALIIPGATDSVYISNTFHDDDSVSCLITNGPCDFTTFQWVYVVYDRTGISSVDADAHLSLYPNPNNGTLMLTGTVPIGNKSAPVEISDVTGRVVYSSDVPINNGVLNKQIVLGENFGTGVYFLRVLTSGGPTVIRFVVR